MTEMLRMPLWDGMPASCGCLCARQEFLSCSVCAAPLLVAKVPIRGYDCRERYQMNGASQAASPFSKTCLSPSILSAETFQRLGAQMGAACRISHT